MDRLMIKPPPLLLLLPFNALLVVFLILLVKPTFSQQQQQPPPPGSFNSTTTTHPLRSRLEHRALLSLRSSLALRAKDWPLKSDPCSTWRGISCQNGTVAEINISGLRRTRLGRQNPLFAVGALANLTHLETFNASMFLLPGQIPELFGQQSPLASTLRLLDLRSCSIIGVIPESLGGLTRLTGLYLSGNLLSGPIPSGLGGLVSLSVLDLSRNSLTERIPVSLGSLTNLTVLDVSSNFLFGLIPPEIGFLSKLQVFNCSNNSLAASVPPQLGDLASLVDLDLTSNSLTDSLPPDLTGLKRLRRMLVGNNELSGELPNGFFQSLNQLEVVDLGRNNFSGNVPDVLWSMSTLLVVDVSGNNFTGTLPEQAASSNAAGLLFNLSNNKYYGQITSVIQRFSFVDLSSNYFEGKVLVVAGSNTSSVVANCLQNVTRQRTLEECSSFYGSKGLTFDNFGDGNTTSFHTLGPVEKPHNRTKVILASVLGGVGLLLLLLLSLFLIFFCIRRRRGSSTQRGIGVGPTPVEGPTTPTATSGAPHSPALSINYAILGEAFTKDQLNQATNGFSERNLIKNGHSGVLYKGALEGGIPVVVKKVDLTAVKNDGYSSELNFFSKVSHPRLVSLLGHCSENQNEKYIVYKYMPNGDLSSSLHKKVKPEDDSLQSLDWITRLKIAIGVAEGLCYLHHECTPPFVHRDVQASSILLDDKFEVRLGSLSEIGVQEGDAHHSMVTRFLRMPQTSEQGTSGSKSSACTHDVYCFGKVLLELVTGNLGISSSNDASAKEWIDKLIPSISIYDKELINKIVDPSLILDEDLLEEVWAMAIVARSCLNPRPSKRPLMRYILKALENPLKVVREESNTGSARMPRTSSSRGSWNAAVFGSWRQSSSETANMGGPGSLSRLAEGVGPSSLRRSATSNSQGSGGRNGNGNGNSASRRQSREVFPEPFDVERQRGK